MTTGFSPPTPEDPLRALRIAVTRPGAGSSGDRLSRMIRELGGRPVPFPLTRIVPAQDPEPLDRAVRRIGDYDWLVLTSARAVGPLVASMRRGGIDPKHLVELGVRVCAVGPRTADALRTRGFDPDLVPDRFAAEGVVEALRGRVAAGRGWILFPRAEGGRDVIPRELEQTGARVDVVTAYRSVSEPAAAEQLAEVVQAGEIDVLTFTAGSAASAFVAAGRATDGSGRTVPRSEVPPGIGVVAIGPATASVLKGAGIRVDRVAEPHSFEGLVAAVRDWSEDGGGRKPGGGP